MVLDIKDRVGDLVAGLIEEAIDPRTEKYKNGLYVHANLDPTAVNKMWTYFKRLGIPPMPINKAHVTVIYSPRAPRGQFQIKDINGVVRPKAIKIFGKGTRQSPYALVIEFNSPDLVRLRNEYHRKYQLNSTHREYHPHMTITYDIDRVLPGLKKLGSKQKETIENIFSKMIQDLPKSIRILNQEAARLED